MNKSKSGHTILCTWEMGSDLGHVSRLSHITKALESEGHRVVLALKDLSRAYPFFKDTQAQLIQAPIWLLKLKMQRPIACQADALLLSGYVDAEALLMLTKAWQTIVDLVKPDLVVFDYSPTAQIALRDDTRAKIIVGNGFSQPEPGQPLADWRHYDANDNLVAEQERVALHPINITLKQLNKTPLQILSELWRADKMILSEFHHFDPYHDVRTNTVYCLKQETENHHQLVVFPDSGRKKVIAYLKAAHPKFDQILQALSLCNADVFVACPRAPDHILKAYESDKFRFSTRLTNLPEGLKRADLFVGHGNGGTVKEALIAEIPVVVVPLQQEQLFTGKKLQELGAGLLIPDFENATTLSESINGALNNPELFNCVKGLSQSLIGSDQTVPSAVISCVEELLF